MKLKRLITKLQSIPTTEVAEFEEVLADIGDLENSECISALAPFLDDEAVYPELMWSILRTMEAFDNPTYIEGLLESLPVIWRRAPGWARTFVVRVINSDEALAELICQLKRQSVDTKALLRAVVESVVKESPDKKPRAASVLAAAE